MHDGCAKSLRLLVYTLNFLLWTYLRPGAGLKPVKLRHYRAFPLLDVLRETY